MLEQKNSAGYCALQQVGRWMLVTFKKLFWVLLQRAVPVVPVSGRYKVKECILAQIDSYDSILLRSPAHLDF